MKPARSRWPWALALFLILLLILNACSNSDDDGGTAPALDDGEEEADLLWEETSAALADANLVFDQQLTAMPVWDLFGAAAAALGDHDCVASVAVDSSGGGDPQLVAAFTNGVVLVVPVIRVDSLRVDRPFAPPAASTPGLPLPGKNNALPDGDKVLLLDNPAWDTDVADWKTLLEQAGYFVDYTTDFPLDIFTTLGAYDVIYVSSHGLLFEHQGQTAYGMTTTQYRSTDEELAMLAAGDFQDLSVTLQGAVYIPENEDPYHPDAIKYMVTNRFIEKYCSAFPDNSLFYADCCQSMLHSTLPDSLPLARTLTEMNMGTLIGWDGSVDESHSTPMANYLMGLMLGNMDSSLRWVTHPSPPLRPWSLVDVLAALQRQDLHHDQDGVEVIVLQLAGAPEPLLRPSIGQCLLEVDAEANIEELKLLGRFGDTQGTVTIYANPDQAGSGQGTELTVSSWEPTRVTAEIDQQTAGYVQVEVDGITSNIHPLSHWEGDIEVSGVAATGSGPQFTLTIKSDWRAEIVDERPRPEDPPLGMNGWTGTMLGKTATCEYDFFGTFEDSRYIYEYPQGANQGTQPMGLNDTQMFFGTVTLKPSEGEADFQILMSREVLVMKTDKQVPGSQPEADMVQVSVGCLFTADITSGGVITEGETSVPYQTSWPTMEPEYPVREDTGR